MSDEILVDVTEAGRRLSLSRSVVYELLDSGELRSLKVGARRLVPVSQLHALVARALGDDTRTDDDGLTGGDPLATSPMEHARQATRRGSSRIA
jgi:excisionase family DNA binding protein